MSEEIDFSEIKENLKKCYNNAQKDRYKHFGRFKFDRWIFTLTMFLVFGYLFFIAYSYGFELDHYECGAPVGKKCINPFFEPMTWKNMQYLSAGVYGAELGLLFNSATYVPALLFGFAFLLNHQLYNKKKKAPAPPQKEKVNYQSETPEEDAKISKSKIKELMELDEDEEP